jgi:hypothetical protein
MAWHSGDGIRASDAERDLVLGELGNGFAAGRLSHDTFMYRVDATLRARRRAELDDQLSDLPAPTRVQPLRDRARSLGRELARELREEFRAAAADWGRTRPLPPLRLPAGPRYRYTIGREPGCDMSIGDQTVSRWHADLCRGPGGWRLADLGSTNGTRLNGWRVTEPVVVRPGDVVSFGSAEFVLTQPS